MNGLAWLLSLGSGACLVALGCNGTTQTTGTGGSGATTTTTTTTGSGGAAATGPADYCEGKLARETTCDGAASQTQAECVADAMTACLFDVTRPEVVAALVDCLNARACGVGDDQCWYDTGMANPTAGQTEYMSACVAKHDLCPNDFATDYCGATAATSAMYATFAACLDLGCTEVKACLDAAVPISCQ